MANIFLKKKKKCQNFWFSNVNINFLIFILKIENQCQIIKNLKAQCQVSKWPVALSKLGRSEPAFLSQAVVNIANFSNTSNI